MGVSDPSRDITRPRNWGRWGDTDQRGVVNLVDPEAVLGALRLPSQGRVYNLAQPIQSRGVPMNPSGSRFVHLFTVDGADYAAGLEPSNGCSMAEDFIAMDIHGTATHIDALGHAWSEQRLYNGFASTSSKSGGLEKCGIEHLGSLVTRGVMLDVARYLDRDYLADSYTITAEDVANCSKHQGVEVRRGDAVLIRTGWYSLYPKDEARYFASRPGIGLGAAVWLAERDVTVVGADNLGVEVVPYPPGTTSPVHQLLLRECGIYLLELLNLEELSQASAFEFLLILAPLPVTGASGSPVNPLAIV
jgi:kynurenine formamidase